MRRVFSIAAVLALAACKPDKEAEDAGAGEVAAGESPAAVAAAGGNPAAETASRQITGDYMREIVVEISDDRYEGRGPGTRGDREDGVGVLGLAGMAAGFAGVAVIFSEDLDRLAGFGQVPAGRPDLLAALLVHVGLAVGDQMLGPLVQLLEVVAGVPLLVPRKPKPADVLLDLDLGRDQRTSCVELALNLDRSSSGDVNTDFDDRRTGNLRLDYLLPSANLDVRDCGVFWPAAGLIDFDPGEASDHRLVWLDIAL